MSEHREPDKAELLRWREYRARLALSFRRNLETGVLVLPPGVSVDAAVERYRQKMDRCRVLIAPPGTEPSAEVVRTSGLEATLFVTSERLVELAST